MTSNAKNKTSVSRRKKRPLRIGIYDGTFNPLHYGHLICAEWVREAKNLDKVLFLTCGNPPNKTGFLDAEERHEIVLATISDNPYFEASRLSLTQRGTGYSLNAVEAVRDKYGEDCELYYLLSSEYLNPDYRWSLRSWIGGKELFKLVTFLVFPRDNDELAKIAEWAKLVPEASIETLYVPSPEFSSTMIRENVKAGRSIWYLLPWVTQQMIAKKGLYRDDSVVAEVEQHSQQCSCHAVSRRPIKRLAIFGGRFDPIHYGQLLLAEYTRQEYALDRVVFATLGNPPNSKVARLSAEERHEMVVAATAENPYFSTSRVDLDRGTTSYALLTVQDIRREYGENVEYSLLISADYLNLAHEVPLSQWMGFEELKTLVRFLVFPGENTTLAEAGVLAEKFRTVYPGTNVEVMNSPRPNVTGALLRERAAKGLSLQYTMPWAVQQIIAKRGLYKLPPVKAKRKTKVKKV
jgi:nicotinate-nucleotide adenylyltransferase